MKTSDAAVTRKPSRQVSRHEKRVAEFRNFRREFGGFTDRGGYYYPQGVTRRIARQIARDKVKRLLCNSESPEPSTYCTFDLGHGGKCSWERGVK